QIAVRSIPNFKSIRRFIWNFRKAKAQIRKVVQEHDIIVTRLPSATGKIAAEVSLELRKPILAEFVACTFDAYWNYGWKGKLIAHYKMWQQRRLVKRLPYIVYVTERFLQERYPSSAKQISCSNVELDEFGVEVLRA